MRAADEEVKRRAEADAKRQIEASRVAAANEVAAAPVRVFSFVVFSPTVCPYIHTEPVFINLTHNSQGFPAAFNAAAVAAIASGDASKVHVILRIVRAPGTPASRAAWRRCWCAARASATPIEARASAASGRLIRAAGLGSY